MARDFSREPLPYTGEHKRYSTGSAPAWRRPLTSKAMLALACILFAVVVFSHGIDAITVSLWLAMCAIWFLGHYFESRRYEPPTAVERVAALIWRAFRTLVCVGFGVGVIVGSVFAAVKGIWPMHSLADMLILGCWILIALPCIWWGLVGNQWGAIPRADLALYREKKRRYGWRF